MVLSKHVPAGLVGFLLAGLMAAFMSNFAATVNSAPAYLVNDVYKRFINRGVSPKIEVRLSRLASVAVLSVGMAFGLLTNRITDVMMWIVGALYGGYVVSNVLKWYWWRFNGYGYFWGMATGIVGAMVVPALTNLTLGQTVNPLFCFPMILVISTGGSLLATFLTEPNDEATLKHFYRTVNPWGFWGPIREQVLRDDPTFLPNRNFSRDAVNVAIGIVWQLCLVLLPIFLVFRQWPGVLGTASVLVATSVMLKFSWYDRLDALRIAVPAGKAH
jgi:hypothetical protein